jgi:hypothetical protein
VVAAFEGGPRMCWVRSSLPPAETSPREQDRDRLSGPGFWVNYDFETARMQLAKFVKFREEKFGGVLFETRSEKVYTLNSTATAVVREIEAGRDEREIIKRLQDGFQDTDGAIEREVAALIADLRQRGLLEG